MKSIDTAVNKVKSSLGIHASNGSLEGSMDHLLHCPIACELGSLVFCLFGIHWVMPHKVIELF